jgi:hypothetical protein
MSGIINFRLTTLIETYGLDQQFGYTPGKGIIDALFAIRTALQLRREHQFLTYAVFVDLIKAFDKTNHDLLFALLLPFGAPEGPVDIIRRLHKDFKLKFTLEKLDATIDYTVGVRQGDNMAAMLFLFLMHTVMESLKLCWSKPESKVQLHEFRHMPTTKTAKGQHGRLRQQHDPTKTKGRPFHFSDLLFADDGSFLFGSFADLVTGTTDLHQTFARFGLLMHAGTTNADGSLTKSKTEAMFCPPAGPTSELAHADVPEPFYISPTHHIPFTNEFCYLGSILTTDLSDDRDITVRIRKGMQQVGALTALFRNKAVVFVPSTSRSSIPPPAPIGKRHSLSFGIHNFLNLQV